MKSYETDSGPRWSCPVMVLWLVLCAQTCLGFYSPSQGRWLSRDPIGESASRNLHGFLKNKSLVNFDILGLCDGPCSTNTSAPCSGVLSASYTTNRVYSVEEGRRACAGSVACAPTTFTVASECVECACSDWQIKYTVNSTCSITFTAPSAGVTYLPSEEKAFQHELCHCEDASNVLRNLMDMGHFPNKERCEAARRLYDSTFKSRFDQRITTWGRTRHNPKDPCYATFTTP